MRVMGLDLSTMTGVAIVGGDKKVIYAEEVTFKKERGWPRASSIAGRILEIHEEHKPDLVVCEGYGFANAHSLVTLVEIGSIVRYFLWQEGIKSIECPPNSLKKFVTGKGNSKKEEIMMAVLKHWGYESATNNIADAVGLGMFGLGCLGVTFPAISMKAVEEVMKSQGDVVNPVCN